MVTIFFSCSKIFFSGYRKCSLTERKKIIKKGKHKKILRQEKNVLSLHQEIFLTASENMSVSGADGWRFTNMKLVISSQYIEVMLDYVRSRNIGIGKVGKKDKVGLCLILE